MKKIKRVEDDFYYELPEGYFIAEKLEDCKFKLNLEKDELSMHILEKEAKAIGANALLDIEEFVVDKKSNNKEDAETYPEHYISGIPAIVSKEDVKCDVLETNLEKRKVNNVSIEKVFINRLRQLDMSSGILFLVFLLLSMLVEFDFVESIIFNILIILSLSISGILYLFKKVYIKYTMSHNNIMVEYFYKEKK